MVEGDKGAFVVWGIGHVGLELRGLWENVVFEVDVVCETAQRFEEPQRIAPVPIVQLLPEPDRPVPNQAFLLLQLKTGNQKRIFF